jgi:hypothetical protein
MGIGMILPFQFLKNYLLLLDAFWDILLGRRFEELMKINGAEFCPF